MKEKESKMIEVVRVNSPQRRCCPHRNHAMGVVYDMVLHNLFLSLLDIVVMYMHEDAYVRGCGAHKFRHGNMHMWTNDW